MADLESLIKYRTHQLDEKKKLLAELFKEAEQIELQKHTLLENLEREKLLTKKNNSLETSVYFGNYAELIMTKIESLDKAKEKLETRISLAQEEVRNAFAELKKVEITNDRRKEEEKAEINKKISLELDEIGIETFRRAEK